MVLLDQFSKSHGKKIYYDVIDNNWVDVDSIISIVTMNYEKEKKNYQFDYIDATSLDEFVTNKIL